MLELTYEEKHQSLNGSLQVSGLKVVLDTARPAFQRVVSVSLDDGTPVRDDERYLVATSAYIASGGNGYRPITALTDWDKTDLMAHTVFIEHMRHIKRLNSQVQGRLVDLAH
jgi:2',3'-cyclic-nucleotide 2'-phosphodiesterase/3'-nucleotidase